MIALDSDLVAANIARSRREQGLPPTVEDPQVLDRVANIILTEAVSDARAA